MRDTETTVWTIGHSTHTYERLLALLRSVDITAVADVRTSPYSRHFPQFSRDILKDELRTDGLAYSFLGKELGGRPKGSQYYCDGVADYERMAKAPDFQHGVQRVLEGAQKFRIALMCSEHDPLDCHRCLLVGRALAERGVTVKHIQSNGSVVSHREIEEQILKLEGQRGDDLFISGDERLAAAYRKRARKVAYAEPSRGSSDTVAAE
ncbi:DUF488 family protein [Mesorhizobium sp.]|uniref:DUF488 domain-containing protein n=1 Tax=Mesorhizobium sp. TaxID=1871066 RepID=UPI0025EE79B9|nr:DUF488 domain-containing protein [Mesorhizobium sp.]